MNLPRWTYLAVIAGSVGLAALTLQAQDPRPESTGSFAGKAVQVTTKSDPNYTELLVDVEVKTLGDVKFLVGTSRETGGYKNGLTVWIALADVSNITLFASPRDREKRAADFQEAQAKE